MCRRTTKLRSPRELGPYLSIYTSSVTTAFRHMPFTGKLRPGFVISRLTGWSESMRPIPLPGFKLIHLNFLFPLSINPTSPTKFRSPAGKR
jgi:hypothetical protein